MDSLPSLTKALISNFDKKQELNLDKKISVNPIVAEVATWYEKIRNAMDYREDEVMMRSAIERILKRRLLLTRRGKDIAPPLIMELAWARYFPDSSVPEKIVEKVESSINLFLKLEDLVARKHRFNRAKLSEWVFHFMSADIVEILNPTDNKELASNFMFQLYCKKIAIINESEETRDVQTFIAIRRAFAMEDLAFLRYHLFIQYFGHPRSDNLDEISDKFTEGYSQIEYHLRYPLKDRIYSFFKKQSPPFFILEDVLRAHKGDDMQLVQNEEKLHVEVYKAAQARYADIYAKVKRAIIRSVIFIFITKALLALSIEGTYESLFFGSVQWLSIAFNTAAPPILMIIVGLSIRTPGKENTDKIWKKIKEILYTQDLVLNHIVTFDKKSRFNPIFEVLFSILWLVAFFIGFGGIVFILIKLNFNIVSQAVFLFFIAIVSFLSYRIYQIAHKFTYQDDRESLVTVLFDFFFMPFVQVGKSLTLGFSQINIVLLFFDFIIETPFKSLFSFFEQWFLYLRSEREKLD